MIVVVCLGVLVWLRPAKQDPNAPRYVPVTTQPTGPFGSENYNWIDSAPFEGGKVWVWTLASRTNIHSFLYDLDKRLVVGELLNGAAVHGNQDQTKLLCEGFSAPALSFKDQLSRLLNKITLGRIPANSNRIETFWLLDLRNNSAVRLGNISQIPGTGSSWVPAPGFRHSYNRTWNNQGQTVFLCDLEKNTFNQIQFTNEVQGWWDDHDLLVKDAAGNFSIFDVQTRETKMLFSADAINQFLKEQGIPNDPAGIAATRNWNGSNFDFYFSGRRDRGLKTNTTFLLKAERAGPALKLLYRDFQFIWSAQLDATATHYLYDGSSGPPGNGGNGGVFLRDLVNHTERTIVPPDNAGRYAMPRFYGNEVIYSRGRALWRIDLEGTHATRLFPPSGEGN